MKKTLAILLAVFLLVAMTPTVFAAGSTVYVSVSVDGKLAVAAQPVSSTDLSVDGVLKAVHAAYYSGGTAGYASGIDKTWNMFMISEFWGVKATPYVLINGVPLGSDASQPTTADKATVKGGDNLVVSVSSDAKTAALAIGLTASVSGTNATITATNWTLDFTTFKYATAPYANAKVVDAKGAALGTTDASGKATIAIPKDGIIAIDGAAAINLSNGAPAAAAAKLPQTGGVSASTMIGLIGLGLIAVSATTIVVSKKRTSKV